MLFLLGGVHPGSLNGRMGVEAVALQGRRRKHVLEFRTHYRKEAKWGSRRPISAPFASSSFRAWKRLVKTTIFCSRTQNELTGSTGCVGLLLQTVRQNPKFAIQQAFSSGDKVSACGFRNLDTTFFQRTRVHIIQAQVHIFQTSDTWPMPQDIHAAFLFYITSIV